MDNFDLDAKGKEFLKNKVIFTIGHDHMFRPIVYLAPKKVKAKDMHLFEECVCFFYLAIQQELFKEYFIENYILIIDIEGMGFLNFPFKALRSLIDSTSLKFSGRLHKLIFLNPTFMFNGFWKIVKAFLHPESLERISFIANDKLKDLLKIIDKSQLIEKYGGTMKEPETVFPIRTTFTEASIPNFECFDGSYEPEKIEVVIKSLTVKQKSKMSKWMYFFEEEMDVI